MGFLDKVFGSKTEKMQPREVRGGTFPGLENLTNNWLSVGPGDDGWQRNIDITGAGARNVPTVYACVMAISRAVSQCYPEHIKNRDGDFSKVTTSAAYRVLNNPNSYQTGPEFLLNLMATALFEGEAFCVVRRNDRYEISEIHLLPRGCCSPFITDDKEIFYSVGESPLAPGGIDYLAPQRDILHLKFHTPRHPLIGESPIKAAAMAVGINVELSKNQAAFFAHMSRPSGILSTDMKLTAQQMAELRAAFEAQSKDMNAGRIPILGGGMSWQPLGITSQDAQVVQAQRMSIEEICRVFGVPPPLIGDLSNATLSNAETMIQHFLSMGLGSYLEGVERAFDRLFGLGANEYVELDTAALLRTDFAGRIDGLTKAVQGGLMTPDEARAREGLNKIKGGDSAFLQRQMVPIDKISDLLEKETEKPEPVVAPPPPEEVEPSVEEAKADPVITRALMVDMMRQKAI